MGHSLLYHLSEQQGIARFEPRHHEIGEALVWAIDDAHLHNYLLPRDCPRVTYYALPDSDPADIRRYLGPTRLRAVVAIEAAWFTRARMVTLYRYGLPVEPFREHDAGAGYYVTPHLVVPLEVEKVADPLAELLAREVELRVMPSLWRLCDAVVASSLQFSMIRMRNAQPRSSEA